MLTFLAWTAGCLLAAVVAVSAAVAGWPTVAAVAATWGLAALLVAGPSEADR